MGGKQQEARAIVGPPWATSNQEKSAPKKRDVLEETITKMEKGLGRRLSDNEKDRVAATLAFHVKSKE